jgi:hypothetical protein
MRDPAYVVVPRKRVPYDTVERIAIRLSAGGMKIGLHQDHKTGEVRAFVDGEPLNHGTHERDHYECLEAVRQVGRGARSIQPEDPMLEERKVRARGKEWMRASKGSKK